MATANLSSDNNPAQCGQCLEVHDNSKSNVVTCIKCKRGFHTSCVYLGGIKSANLPRVNWLCDRCADAIRVGATKNADEIDKLRDEVRELKDLVLKGFAEMGGEVNRLVKKSSNEVGAVVEERVREAVTSAVTTVTENMVTGEATSESAGWSDVVRRGKKRRGKNLLVVKADSIDGKAIDSKKDVATALAGVPISDSRFTSGGNIVINFEDEAIRNEAAERLKTVENVKTSSVKKIMPKIMLCNVSKGDDKDELMAKLIEKNECLQSIEGVEGKMKLIFEKPAAGNTIHYIIKCDPGVRASIHRHGDMLKLDWGRYKVRDRYHALVCFYCQRFGHLKANCSFKENGEKQTCPRCTGDHEIKDCESDFKKCINCVRADRGGDQGHTVNELCCPLMASELQKVRDNTDHGYAQ